MYFQFSKPLFSKDGQYARVSILKNRKCNGRGYTRIYKKENGVWVSLIEYNHVKIEKTITHVWSKCDDLFITFED